MTNQVSACHVATAAVVSAGVVGAAYGLYYVYQEGKKTKLPTSWKEVGTLKKMFVYPIKSCAPVHVDMAECSALGLKVGWLRDRGLMVVDRKNNFVTARALSELVTVKATMKNSVLTLAHADMEPCNVNLADVVGSKTMSATVWGVTVPVVDCGYEPSEWFSRLIDKSPDNYRLTYYPSQKCRNMRGPANKFFTITKDDTGIFQDQVSYNLVNEASIADLNKRLLDDCKVTEANFRPNFVLSGLSTPFAEDNWKFIKIGDNIFEIVKPCQRCILTTVDPETGIRNSKAEPLETLRKYRKIEDPEMRKYLGVNPRMGVQMALRSGPGGTVSINDPIYVA